MRVRMGQLGQYLQNPGQNGRRLLTGLLAVAVTVAMIASWRGEQAANNTPFLIAGSMVHGPAGGQQVMGGYAASGSAASGSAASGSAASGSTTVSAGMAQSEAKAAGSQRMVIQQATINITLPHVTAIEAQVASRTTAEGGFVESAAQSLGSGNAPSVTMALRIPQSHFAAFVAYARKLGTVSYFSQTGQDVTQQYSGLGQRMAELRSEQAAYTRLYAKAQTMRDMLQIQQALSQVDGQIASVTAEEHSLSRAVQMSSVFLTLSTTTFSSSAPPPIVAAWNQMVATIGASALAVVTMVAWIVPWAIGFFLLLLAGRLWTRARDKR